jgi:hypothetical protein
MLGVANLLLAIDKLLKMEESQNTDETESALEALGLIGTTSAGACLLLTDSSNAARHVVEASFGRQGRGKQLAALHAFGSISGVDRQEDQIKLDNQAEERLKRFVYTTARNSPKLTPSALLLSVLQQDPDIRITVSSTCLLKLEPVWNTGSIPDFSWDLTISRGTPVFQAVLLTYFILNIYFYPPVADPL